MAFLADTIRPGPPGVWPENAPALRFAPPAEAGGGALTRTDLLVEESGPPAEGSGVYTTASFTPPSNSLLVVAIHAMEQTGSTDPSADIAVSGGGWTYTSRVLIGAAPSFSTGLRIFTAPVTTGVSMTLALDFGVRSAYFYAVSVVAYTGYDTDTPTGATGTVVDSSTPDGALSLTLSAAPAASSEVFAALGSDKESLGVTPGSGWTEVHDIQQGDSGGIQTQIRTGSTSDQVDWVDTHTGTGSVFKVLGAAIEIKAAAVEGPAEGDSDFVIDVALGGTGARDSDAVGGVGAVTADIALAATGSRLSQGVAAFSAVITLEGVGSSGGGTGIANFGVSVAFDSTGARDSVAVGDLGVVVALAGTGARASQAVGALSTVITLASTGSRNSLGVGDLGVIVALAGSGLSLYRGTSDFGVTIAIGSLGADPDGVHPVARLLHLSSTYRTRLETEYLVGLDSESRITLSDGDPTELDTEYGVSLTWEH